MDYRLQLHENMLAIVPTDSLDNNTEYKITIDAGLSGYLPDIGYQTLGEDYTFWFTSLYCPLFSSLNRIKLIVGPIADQFIDDTIYRMIYKNSVDAIDLFNLSMSTDYGYTYFGCTQTGVPFKLRRYVECKTGYDLLTLVDQLSNSTGGDQLKTLGDLTISYKGNPGGGKSNPSDPNQKQQLYNCWNDILKSVRTMNVAVRGFWDQGSIGALHPVREPDHNRIIRPQSYNNNQPVGPWQYGYSWYGFKYDE